MRYQDWDVLVFPEDCKVPLQEFRTACQVIQDPESSIYSQNGQMLLPTVTSFIPGLRAGSSFRISIHCWKDPDMSAYLQSITKHAENAIFEARLLIDGKLIGSKFYGRAGPWPSVIETSVELNKHGEFEPLKFPEFHHEVLTQPIWNAGDDIGRVKLIIAEGFPRDSISVPFERVRNLVAFSFQHAPLEVLENCNIAWPNAAMWRQVSIAAPYIARQPPPRNASEGGGIEAHSHSPRRRVPSAKRMTSLPAPVLHTQPVGSMAPPRPSMFDPFIDPEHYWRQTSSSGDVSMRQASSSAGHDISMPDVSKSNTRTNSSRQVTNPIVTDHPARRFETLQSAGAFESVCEALMMPFVPTNTPLQATTANGTPVLTSQTGNAITKRPAELNSGVKAAFEGENNAALEAAASWSPSVKSKKENAHGQDHNLIEEVPRKVAQPFTKTTTSGSKRQRNVTPIAAKVIDEQGEPGSATRKVSRGTETSGKEGERRVLSGIVNV